MERFVAFSPGEEHVKVDLCQQNCVPQVVAFGEGRQKLAKFTQGLFAELHLGRFQIERSALSPADITHAPNTELFEEFIEEAFQIVDIKFGLALLTHPEARISLTC